MVEPSKKEAFARGNNANALPATRACPACGLQVALTVNSCPQDGTNLASSPGEDADLKLKYEFLETIGAGGMGVIYKARQIAINKTVAIKMLHAHLLSDQAFQRFQIEGKAASLLNHKYVVGVHDLNSTAAGQPYMVMDYLEGETLAQELATHGPLKMDRFLRLFLQICDALSHAHNNNVLHRDIKPSNIMLVRTGRGVEEVRIMDFGIAKLLSDSESGAAHLTKTGEALGSPLYMSPEQCRSENIDKRSDIYAVGCVMYEALTGTPPFIGKTPLETIMQHIGAEPLPLSQAALGTEFDAGLEDIVARLLKKDPAARYQSIEELEADLVKLQDATIGGKKVRFIYDDGQPLVANDAREGRNMWIFVGSVVAILIIFSTICFYNISKSLDKAPEAKKPPVVESDNRKIAIEFNRDLDHPAILIADKVRHRDAKIDLKQLVPGVLTIIHDSDLKPLQDATNAETVIIANSPITDAGLEYMKDLRLKRLWLQDTNVRGLAYLKKMKTLELLDVSGSALNTSGMLSISRLTNLKELWLANTGILDQDLPLLRRLINLKYLSLANCSHLTESAIKHLQHDMPTCMIVTAKQTDIQKAGGQLLLDATVAMASSDWVGADNSLRILLKEYKEKAGVMNMEAASQWLEMRGRCQLQLGNYDTAMSFYDQAIHALNGERDSGKALAELAAEKAEVYEKNIVDANVSVKIPDAINKAIQQRQIAAEFYSSTQVPDILTLRNLNRLARDLCTTHQEARSAAIVESELPDYKKLAPASAQYAVALQILADDDLRLNQPEDAIKYGQRSLALFGSEPKRFDQKQELRATCAMAYKSLHRYADAESILKEALNQPFDNEQIRKDQYELLSQTLQAQKKDAEAKHYQELAAELQRKINLKK